MKIADWKGFDQRKREARKRGKLLGLGLCNYVESSIGSPKEQTQIHVRPDGRVDVVIGTQPAGQGHETSFAQVVSDLIQVPVEKVKIILGDTDVVKVGGGSHSGRSMRHAATVFSMAAVDLIDKGKKIAALVLDVPPDSVEFSDDGRFTSRDDQPQLSISWSWRERGRARSQLPDELDERPCRSSPTTRCTIRCSRTAPRSARSRSIPTPAASTSCATRRSTTSAAASIR